MIIGTIWFICGIVLIIGSLLTIGADHWWGGLFVGPVVSVIGSLLVWGGIHIWNRVYWGERE
jgi:hypothetical protein